MDCKECQMENIDGALFCEECGARLESEDVVMDMEMGEGAAEALVLAASDGTTLDVPAKDDIVIGREDPISEVFPDVDLSGLNGMENGVSRKHAVIHRSGSEYTLEDLDSTNGTFINKKRIQSNAPQPFKPGDEIKLGKLTLTVQAA
ncbi:MAG TPA: hypothetical protein DCO77_12215 [Nitrospiraceae bacterium]|nr:hypothetical protein [Nitrospiraceae bacterium]